MMTVVLLNMFVAVFTDAFSNEMQVAFNRSAFEQILDNTANHGLTRSSLLSFAAGSLPVQSLRSRGASSAW